LNTELDRIGAQIREKNGALQLSLRRTVHQAIELGELIAKAKQLVTHGEFIPWIEKQGLEYRTARNYVELFEHKTKCERVSDLTTAYALIEELKAQSKEIKKAVEQKVITPAQAEKLTPGPDFVDRFNLAHQAKRVERKFSRRAEPKLSYEETAEPVETSDFANRGTVERIVRRLTDDLDQLSTDSRRIELCHDLIKYLKAKVNEYQRASVS
jgi:hypothetical protein